MVENMELDEARKLVRSPIWAYVRDAFCATGEFHVYPKGDMRRLAYVDEETRCRLDLWLEGISKIEEWRKVVDGETVRRLKADYAGVYPEVLRYAAYFSGRRDRCETLLKLKFPEVYELCFC